MIDEPAQPASRFQAALWTTLPLSLIGVAGACAAAGAPGWGSEHLGAWWAIWSAVGVVGGVAVFFLQRLHAPRALRTVGAVAVSLAAYLAWGTTLLLDRAAHEEDSWVLFTSKEDGFEILLPEAPGERVETVPGMRDKLKVYVVEQPWRKTAIAVAFGAVPPRELHRVTIEERLQGARESMLAKDPGARCILEKDIDLDPEEQRAREFVLESPTAGRVVARAQIFGNRICMMIVAGPMLDADSPIVRRCFDSFRLLDAPPAAALEDVRAIPGLVAYWRCNDGADDRLRDEMKPEQPAKVVRAAWRRGVEGNGLDLQPSAALELAGTPLDKLEQWAPAALSFWIKVPLSSKDELLTMFDNENDTEGLCWHLDGEDRLNVGWRADRFHRPTVAGKFIRDGRWHHVLVMRDPGPHLEFYVDGQRQGRIARQLKAAAQPKSWRLCAMGRTWLDEVCVFDRELTRAEIAQLAGQSPPTDAGPELFARLPDSVTSLAFSADSKHLLIAGALVRVCEVATKKNVLTLPLSAPAAWTAEQRIFATDGLRPGNSWRGQAYRLVEFPAGTVNTATRMFHSREVSNVGFSADGRWCVTYADGFHCYDLRSGQPTHKHLPAFGHGADTQAITVAPGGLTFAAHSDQSITFFEKATGQVATWVKVPSDTEVHRMLFAPDGSRLVVLIGAKPYTKARDPEILIVSAQTGDLLETLPCPRWPATMVALSPSGRYLLLGDAAPKLWAFDLNDKKEIGAAALAGAFRTIAFAPDGKTVAMGTALDRENTTVHLMPVAELTAALRLPPEAAAQFALKPPPRQRVP